MQRLLAPDGCPWDREQTLETLIPYLVEETYEVIDALAEGTVDDHREELGDLLLQVVFQSELRHAEGHFGIDDVARGIVAKLVRRHPHVFGDVKAENTDAGAGQLGQAEGRGESSQGRGRGTRSRAARSTASRAAPPRWCARSAPARRPARSASTGPTPTGPRAKIAEELAELDRGAGDAAIARAWPTSWATCCSPW